MDGVSHSVVVVGGLIQDVVEAIRLLDVWARRAEAISCVGWALYLARDEKDWDGKRSSLSHHQTFAKKVGCLKVDKFPARSWRSRWNLREWVGERIASAIVCGSEDGLWSVDVDWDGAVGGAERGPRSSAAFVGVGKKRSPGVVIRARGSSIAGSGWHEQGMETLASLASRASKYCLVLCQKSHRHRQEGSSVIDIVLYWHWHRHRQTGSDYRRLC